MNLRIFSSANPPALVELMDLYERNYRLLHRLIPNLQTQGDYLTSMVPGCLPLHLWIEERMPFTSTVRLSYVFDDQSRTRVEPDLRIRVYHDAQLAEALGRAVHRGFRARRACSTQVLKWRMNVFLYKWLRYSLHRGHYFSDSLLASPQNASLLKDMANNLD